MQDESESAPDTGRRIATTMICRAAEGKSDKELSENVIGKSCICGVL
jgi:hypothetical protein